jgi:hypothetical protein
LHQVLNKHYSDKGLVERPIQRRLDGSRQYHAPLPPHTNLQTTCRFCGNQAMPGEHVCYNCAQGGG